MERIIPYQMCCAQAAHENDACAKKFGLKAHVCTTDKKYHGRRVPHYCYCGKEWT